MKFFHIMNKKRTLGITIAVDRTDNQDGTSLFSCATAFCAPDEKAFSRPKGRMIAENRLKFEQGLNSHKKFLLQVPRSNNYREAILNHLLTSVPFDWAKGLLTKELKQYE